MRTATPLVHHGPRRIGAHARGAHQMPPAVAERRLVTDIMRTRGAQDFAGARHRVVQHTAAVLAQCVVDLRRRDAVGIPQHRIERDGVVRLGKVLADRHHAGAPAEQAAIGAMMIGTPGQPSGRHAVHRGHHRPLPAREFERVATHEPARAIGLVELLAPDTISGAAISVQQFVEIPPDPRIGVEHEVPPDQST